LACAQAWLLPPEPALGQPLELPLPLALASAQGQAWELGPVLARKWRLEPLLPWPA